MKQEKQQGTAHKRMLMPKGIGAGWGRGSVLTTSLAATMLFPCAALLLPGSSYAQTAFGAVVGNVTDATSASVPDVSVTLTNKGTGEKRTAATDPSGNYQFLNLPVGQYQIELSKSGFQRLSLTSIEVQVSGTARANAVLQVGQVSDVVEVTASNPPLDTDSGSLSKLIEGRAVNDMPLNGRNVMNLIALAPGVIPQGSTSGSTQGNQNGGKNVNVQAFGNYQISGAIANQSAEFLDGAPLNNLYINMVSIVPTQDAVQEFRVITNELGPEFGRTAGGAISFTTKSGTNSFHGAVWEYLRNADLNANTFFNNRNGVRRPQYNQNQFGLHAGGPILHDRTFFFGSWEGFYLRLATPINTTVPTDAMKSGDFSAIQPTIYDPLTTCGTGANAPCAVDSNGKQIIRRQPFAGNVIPANRIDPTAKAMVYLWHAPNRAGLSTATGPSQNFQTNASGGGHNNQYNARVDHKLSDRDQLFARYTYWNLVQDSADYHGTQTGTPPEYNISHQAVLGATHTFNSTTFLDARVSYTRNHFEFRPFHQDLSKFGPAFAALPTAYPDLPTPSVAGVDVFPSPNLRSNSTANNYAISANFSKILGKHSLKFGVDARRLDWAFIQVQGDSGAFSFNNGFTAQDPTSTDTTKGYGFASFLLGYAASGSFVLPISTYAIQHYNGLYASDVYQVTPKLTLDLGIRYEMPGSQSERKNRLTTLLPNATDPLSVTTGLNLHGQIALAATSAQPDTHIHKPKYDLFAPRVGFAYRPTSNLVVRGGFGINFPPADVDFVGPWLSVTNTATTNMVTSTNGGLTPSAVLSNPFPTGVIQPIGNDASRLVNLEGTAISAPLWDQPYTYTEQWNFGLQQQFLGAVAEIAYAGSEGVHLPVTSSYNQLDPKYYSQGSSLVTAVSNPLAGKVNPTSSLNAATVSQGQLLRPYPQFTSFAAPSSNLGQSIYHSLQTSLQKRFKHGGTVMTNYTWAKFIANTESRTSFLDTATGTAGQQNYYNLNGDRSLLSFDVRHRFIFSDVYDLPIGRGRAFFGNVHGITDKLISDWNVNAIVTLQTGFPLGLSVASSNLPTFGAGTIRPNVVAGCAKKIGGRIQNRLTQAFNTSCFVSPGGFAFGNESRTDNQLRGAGIANYDFSVGKAVAVGDKVKVKLTSEFFNIFNRVQFGNPGTSVGNAATYGIITSQINQPRLIQFGFRIDY